MSNFVGNDGENYDEIVLKLAAEFELLKKKLGDKADIEMLLAQYPENIKNILRNELQTYQQIKEEQTPEKLQALLPKLMLKIHGTLGEQARQYQERQLDPIYIQELVQKGNLNLTAMEQSTLSLDAIRNMSKNELLKLGKQFGLTTNNLQLVQLWLDWLDTLSY